MLMLFMYRVLVSLAPPPRVQSALPKPREISAEKENNLKHSHPPPSKLMGT